MPTLARLNSQLRVVAAAALAMSPLVATAHIALDSPKARSPQTGDVAPCAGGNGKPSAQPTVFQEGQTITVEWHEQIAHGATYRISLAASEEELTAESDSVTVLADDIPDDATAEAGTYSVEVTLPTTPCEACILQVVQLAGFADYYQCADIVIAAGDETPGTDTTIGETTSTETTSIENSESGTATSEGGTATEQSGTATPADSTSGGATEPGDTAAVDSTTSTEATTAPSTATAGTSTVASTATASDDTSANPATTTTTTAPVSTTAIGAGTTSDPAVPTTSPNAVTDSTEPGAVGSLDGNAQQGGSDTAGGCNLARGTESPQQGWVWLIAGALAFGRRRRASR